MHKHWTFADMSYIKGFCYLIPQELARSILCLASCLPPNSIKRGEKNDKSKPGKNL